MKKIRSLLCWPRERHWLKKIPENTLNLYFRLILGTERAYNNKTNKQAKGISKSLRNISKQERGESDF
jgi:hypothetical protein